MTRTAKALGTDDAVAVLQQRIGYRFQQAALLHTMDTGLVHVVGNLIVRVNPALVQLSGKSEDNLLGQPIEALFEHAEQWESILGTGIGKGPVSPNSCIVELSRAADNPLRCEVSVRQVDPMRD